MDETIIEQLKARELELERQLQEEKAKNQRLELEAQFKDKITGLWNRKYLEKVIEEKVVNDQDPNCSVVCLEIENLNKVNDRLGVSAGDDLFKHIADEIQLLFGNDAICCKTAGARICVIGIMDEALFDASIKSLTSMIASVKSENDLIDIIYGSVRKENNADRDLNGLIKEAEYALTMEKVSVEAANGADAPAVAKAATGRQTILMVDDSMTILRTLQMMLKDRYNILMATSGMDGFEIAKVKNPDLILLDYNMPVVDGERVMALLKKSNATKHIPVVFITGVSDKEKILKVAQHKPAGYLLKPVSKDDLLQTVNRIFLEAEN